MSIIDFNSCIWSDPWFADLTRSAQILFIYLWTNDHKSTSGIYTISIKSICFETGLTIDEIRDGLIALQPKVKYDADEQVVWVLNHVKHQFLKNGKTSCPIIISINRSLNSLPHGHPFIKDFIARYPLSATWTDKKGNIHVEKIEYMFDFQDREVKTFAAPSPAAAEAPAPAEDEGESPAEPSSAKPPVSQEAKETTIPKDFSLAATTKAYAKQNGLDEIEIQYQFERFTDHHANDPKGKKKKYKNWQRTFENWITSQYFRPCPPHVRNAREEERNKRLDSIEYELKPMVERGQAVTVPKLPYEEN